MTLTALTQPAGPTRSGPALVVGVASEGPATIVTLRGEADLASLPTLADALARVIAVQGGAVVVDLAHTEFIDTATVRALGRAWQFLDGRDRPLTLRSPSKLAERVLAFIGLSDLIEPMGRSDQSAATA